MKLLTKFALLTDCQRRARQLSDALKTATTQILITLRTSSDADTIRQQVKQWTTVKHELVKSLQDEDKHSERSRSVTKTMFQPCELVCLYGPSVTSPILHMQDNVQFYEFS